MPGQRGFSLIELLVVVAIMGGVIALSVPAFSRYRATLIRRGALRTLIEDIGTARQTSVTRHAPVYMTFGSPPTTTGITSYRVHTDLNDDHMVGASEPVTVRTLPGGVVLSEVALTPIDSLNFATTGILRIGGGGGRLVVQGSGRRDTVLVSAAGMAYRQ